MKYLKLYENSSNDEEVKNIIERAIKNGDITLNIDIEELLNKNKSPRIGTFEYFIEDNAKFISAGDTERMTEYVSKLKEMGADISKLEQLLANYVRYHKITYIEDDLRMDLHNSGYLEDDERKEIHTEINNILDEQESLEKSMEEFEVELRKVVKDIK